MSSNSSQISFLKFLFLIFTGIWILLGLSLVLIGTILKTNYQMIIGSGMEMVIKRVPNTTVFLFVAVGAIIVLASVLANCGSAMNDTRMLYSFSVINVLLLLAQFVTIGLAVKFADRLEASALKEIDRAITHYKWSKSRVMPIDNLQTSLKCCGARRHQDWHNNQHYNISRQLYPFSCCHHSRRHSSECTTTQVLNRVGCIDSIAVKFSYRVFTLIGISSVICFIQSVLIILTFKLIRAINNYQSI